MFQITLVPFVRQIMVGFLKNHAACGIRQEEIHCIAIISLILGAT